MPVPDFQTLMLPVLKYFADGEEKPSREVREPIAAEFGLTDAEMNEMLPSGRQTRFANRIAWALGYLKQAHCLETPQRGVYRITPRGKTVLTESSTQIDIAYLMRFPEFVAFRNAGDEEETVEPAVSRGRRVDLTHGGIDGIIKEDRLGLESIYIQAKRWEGTVGRPVIQQFAGALQGQRARKGVLITTSSFTGDAVEYVRNLQNTIVLIDGRELTQLMIDYGIGVSDVETIRLKKLDEDYFADE